MVLSFPDTFSRSGDSSSSWRSKSETEKVEEIALSVAGMKWRDVGHCPPALSALATSSDIRLSCLLSPPFPPPEIPQLVSNSYFQLLLPYASCD